MFIRLIVAGSGDFKQVLRRRCILYGIMAAAGLLTLAVSLAGTALGLLEEDFLSGFYAGIGGGLLAGGLYALINTRRTLKNPARLRAAEVKETDERNREVSLRALSATAWILLVVFYAVLLVSVFFSRVVFWTVFCLGVCFFVTMGLAWLYYNRKL